VIAKYEQVDARQIEVHLDRQGDCEVMELSIVLSETQGPSPDRRTPLTSPA
jgi:septum formation topological specificity factor MinE